MLEELHVRNLGVLPEARVSFAPGLNVVTGETGAGKTLLMTSLALLAGGRGDARLIGPGADEAVIEAVLSVPAHLEPHLAERGFDEAGEMVLTRRVGADGRSRAWIGGRLANLSALAEVCGLLLETHGQGAGFALARQRAQLDALDALAGTESLVHAYQRAHARVRDLSAERERLDAEERVLLKERELLAFQVQEIEQADLDPDEEDTLSTEIARLEHADRLARLGLEALTLAGSDGAAGRLAEAHKQLSEAAHLDPEVAALASRLGSLAAETAEAAWDLRAWTEHLEPDPDHLEALRQRAQLLAGLKRKYGATVAEVLDTAAEARARLTELEALEERNTDVSRTLSTAETELAELGDELSEHRQRAATLLGELVRTELPALALPRAAFEVRCDRADAYGERGRDRVQFLFSENASRPPEPLGKTASGGELSRAMIAVTLALAQAHAVPVLVFDEADQGVGGHTALEVARRLGRLALTHQVLVVSHLPQIAAFADRHLVVGRDGDGAAVRTVEESERLEEISRMLAGLSSSELARAHAAELVDLARSEARQVAAGPRSS